MANNQTDSTPRGNNDPPATLKGLKLVKWRIAQIKRDLAALEKAVNTIKEEKPAKKSKPKAKAQAAR